MIPSNSHRLWIIISLAALAVIVLYFYIDIPVSAFFQKHKHDSYNEFFKIITNLGRAEVYLVPSGILCIAAFICSRRGKATQGIARKAIYVFLTVAVSGIVVDICKPIFGRARPKLLFNDQIYGFTFFNLDHEYFSFPSGHSATALGAAVALFWFFPRYRIICFIMGTVVAFSRLAVVAHYVSDVVAGCLIGIAVAIVVQKKLFKGNTTHHG